MSFFHKKKCHKMFGPPLCHLDQVLIFYWPKKNFWASFSRPSFQALGTACSKKDMDVNERLSNITLKVGTACSKKDMDVNERLSNITLKDELK